MSAPPRRDGPAGRIQADPPSLIEHVADAFGLGQVDTWAVLTTGYEDCNIDLRTTPTVTAAAPSAPDRVVVKVFATGRRELATRTCEIITRVRAAGVRHPRLRLDRTGVAVHEHAGHQLLVMDYVPANSFYDLRRAPDASELAAVVQQAALIHTVAMTPVFVHDPWAITNLEAMLHRVADVLDGEQHRLVDAAATALAGVDRMVLPTVLNHGDLTKGNVLVDEHATVHVLDFAVANRLPRVQELAVIAANLTHGDPTPLPERVETIADLYCAAAATPLSAVEREALRRFGHAAAAMELLGALDQWQHGNRGPETEYLIELGMAGLRDIPAPSAAVPACLSDVDS